MAESSRENSPVPVVNFVRETRKLGDLAAIRMREEAGNEYPEIPNSPVP